jgi:hypothetical protein
MRSYTRHRKNITAGERQKHVALFILFFSEFAEFEAKQITNLIYNSFYLIT